MNEDSPEQSAPAGDQPDESGAATSIAEADPFDDAARVPAASTPAGRYVRLFGWVVAIAMALAVAALAVALVSNIHRG